MTNLPPEFWYSLAGVGLTLLVSAAHRRGYRLPLLEVLLDVVHGPAPAAPTPGNAPATPPVTLATILDELRIRLPHPTDAAKP